MQLPTRVLAILDLDPFDAVMVVALPQLGELRLFVAAEIAPQATRPVTLPPAPVRPPHAAQSPPSQHDAAGCRPRSGRVPARHLGLTPGRPPSCRGCWTCEPATRKGRVHQSAKGGAIASCARLRLYRERLTSWAAALARWAAS